MGGVMRMAVLAAAGLMAAAAPAMAQPSGTLADGRRITLPADFGGCEGEWTVQGETPVYNGVCDGGAGVLAVTLIEPGSDMTPEGFVDGVTAELGNKGGVQVLPIQTAGGKGTFVCWLDWSSDTDDGLALCALREPTVRLSIMRTAQTNSAAMQRLQAAVKEITIR